MVNLPIIKAVEKVSALASALRYIFFNEKKTLITACFVVTQF